MLKLRSVILFLECFSRNNKTSRKIEQFISYFCDDFENYLSLYTTN